METFCCEICNYKTFRKFDLNKHLTTKKHKKNAELKELLCQEKKNSENSFFQKNPKKGAKIPSNFTPISSKNLQNGQKSRFLGQNGPPISSDFPPISSGCSQKCGKKTHFVEKNTFCGKKTHFAEKKTHFPEKCGKKTHFEEAPFFRENSNIENFKSYGSYSEHLENFNNYSDLEDYEENLTYTCKYCSATFSRRDNLNRHLEKRCKMRASAEQKERIMLEYIRQDKVAMIEKHEREKEEYRRHIEKLLDKVGTTTITNTNCGNTQTNNVQLNNFGQEDLTMLTDKYMHNMVNYPYSAIPKLIKKIHFNDKYPANRNIRMLNKKDNKLQIRNNGQWEYVDKKETLQLLIEDKNYQLDKYYEDNKEKFDNTKQRKFENFQEKLSIEDKKVNHEIKMDTELVFWNSM